jgi:hypothetical protein
MRANRVSSRVDQSGRNLACVYHGGGDVAVAEQLVAVGYSVPTTNGSASTTVPTGAIVKQPARRS